MNLRNGSRWGTRSPLTVAFAHAWKLSGSDLRSRRPPQCVQVESFFKDIPESCVSLEQVVGEANLSSSKSVEGSSMAIFH